AQLEQLAGFVANKRTLASRYIEAFRGMAGVSVYVEPGFACSNYWLNALLLDRPEEELRDQLLADLNAAGVLARPTWNLLHTLPMFAAAPRMQLPGATALAARI